MISVLQDWVMGLGLRHQGALLSAVRGCDSVPKEDASKSLVRAFRSYVLVSFDRNPTSFIENMSLVKLRDSMRAVIDNFDHYPIHYILHLIHAAEIVGYKHPVTLIRQQWEFFYTTMCHKMHMTVESGAELDERLHAEERVFEANG